MNLQEQEERDYNPQSECRNAFDQSRMEMDRGDDITALTDAGWHVLVFDIPRYCPSTDGFIGCTRRAIFKSMDREEVEAELERRVQHVAFDEDIMAYIAPLPAPTPKPIVSVDPDVPF